MGFQGLEFRVTDLGFRSSGIYGQGFGIQGLGVRV